MKTQETENYPRQSRISSSFPSIGIVVLTHDRDITPFLSAIVPYIRENHDLCIVEGGSTKEWVERNRHVCLNANVKHHWIPQEGKYTAAMGRNYGANKVAGEYLYFIDGDCIPEPGILTIMEMAASPESIAVGRVQFKEADGRFLDDHRLPQFGYGCSVTTYPWMMDEKNVMIPRRLFDMVGGFQVGWAKNSYCWEGVDLYCRLFIRRQTPIVLMRNALVTHIQDHPKNPDQQKSDENVKNFHHRIEQYLEIYGEEHHTVLDNWMQALRNEMRDRR